MTNDNNKPGADAPGEKKAFVRRSDEHEAARAASAPAATDAHRAAARPRRRQADAVVDPALEGAASGTDAARLDTDTGRRQAEEVVDPHLDDTCSQPRTLSLIAVLPPEAVVRLVLVAGRMARKQGKPLPQNISKRLGEALARGDAAAPALCDWVVRIGVLDDRPVLTPAGSRDTDPDVLGGNQATEHNRATMRAVALARHLRERLGVGRSMLRAKAGRKTSRGSRPPTLSDSGEASPTVSDDTGRQS